MLLSASCAHVPLAMASSMLDIPQGMCNKAMEGCSLLQASPKLVKGRRCIAEPTRLQ